jgi:hypothetical protein
MVFQRPLQISVGISFQEDRILGVGNLAYEFKFSEVFEGKTMQPFAEDFHSLCQFGELIARLNAMLLCSPGNLQLHHMSGEELKETFNKLGSIESSLKLWAESRERLPSLKGMSNAPVLRWGIIQLLYL